MKRFDSPVSFGSLTSICVPIKDERSPRSTQLYSQEFQAMLDRLEEEDCLEESNIIATEKKRRLSLHQVTVLEKYFEIENKLEPERKAKLAEELGLQPRQVAVWFQNRRARWKTKRLERDYKFLKTNYDALRLSFDELEREKEALNAELNELKGKLPGENAEGNYSVKEQSPLSSKTQHNNASEQSKKCEFESAVVNRKFWSVRNVLGFKEFEDGPSDSDSSGNLKEESHNFNAQLLISPAASSSCSSFGFNCSSQLVSPMDWFQMSDCRAIPEGGFEAQFVRMEEQGLYSTTEEFCNFLSVDQAPTLHSYYTMPISETTP